MLGGDSLICRHFVPIIVGDHFRCDFNAGTAMKKTKKSWKTPTFIELPITMEIAAYRSAQIEEK